MTLKSLLSILKVAAGKWLDHNAPRLGAALAFYTILSLSPLVILLVAIAALVFSHSTAQSQILGEVQSLVGFQGEKAVESVLLNAQNPATGLIGTILGLASLVFGASGVCGELRSALNIVWDVVPENSAGFWGMLKERFFSFGMVLSIGFLLTVSLVVSSTLAVLGKFFEGIVPVPIPLLMVLNFLISFGGIAFIFGLIFRFVPAARIDWKNVVPGALVTALMFNLGKFAIGLYLGRSSVASPYGAAGSLIVVLVWVYYSAQLFLFGAEFTHAYAERNSALPKTRGSEHRAAA